EVALVGFGGGREREVVAAQENGEATNRAREWQNAPANELTPDALAQEATQIAQRHNLEIEVLGPAELKAGGYNLLLGVGAGSAKPPRLIRVRYHGTSSSPGGEGGSGRMAAPVGRGEASTENVPVLALIGKGITFDSADGKTVEIVNTDAEGRLVLADALTHALRNGATHLIDLATLTGAATVAIGHAASAATSNDDDFWSVVDQASREAGDRVWRLP